MLRVLISKAEIEEGVSKLAGELRKDYEGSCPVLVGVLKGSFVFMADLIRELNVPVVVDFARLSSYDGSRRSPGEVRLLHAPEVLIGSRHVLVVEDIVDSGRTARCILRHLARRKPLSLRLCTLLDKPSRRVVEVPISYRGFVVPDAFVVGYGLDSGEGFRYLPDICVEERDSEQA